MVAILIGNMTGCERKSTNTEPVSPSNVFTELEDTDLDQIPDIYDDFPNDPNEFTDANFNGIGDNQDGSAVNRGGSREDIITLKERIVSFNTGLGSLEIDPSSSVYSQVGVKTRKIESKVTAAIAHYEDGQTYNLKFDEQGNIISANRLTQDKFGSTVEDIYFLALGSHLEQDENARQLELKAMNLVKWLRWNGIKHNDVSLMDGWYLSVFGQAVLLLEGKLYAYGLHEYLLSLMWQGRVGKSGINELVNFDYSNVDFRDDRYYSADLLRTEIFYHFAGIILLPENTSNQVSHKIAKLTQFKRYLAEVLLPTAGLHSFLKPDGSAYHHYTNYMSAYSGHGVYSLTRLGYLLSGTHWALDEEQFSLLSEYVKGYYFYCSLYTTPAGGRGRFPYTVSMPKGMYEMTYVLADILPNDDVLQQMVVNYHQKGIANNYSPTYRLNQMGFPGVLKPLEALTDKINSGAEPKLISGAHYFPYSSMYAARQSNWLATIKGFDRWSWSYEGGITASNKENLYGLYDNYGSLEVNYFDKSTPTDGEATNQVGYQHGHQWSHVAGTTVPYRTSEEMLEDRVQSRLRLQKTSTGGVGLNSQDGTSHGIYMLDLSGFLPAAKDVYFTARKSYFQLGNKIIALGSSISNQATKIEGKIKDYPIHTTVLQTRSIKDSASEPIYVDSANPISDVEYSSEFASGDALILVDNYQTGYFLPDNNGVKIERGNMTSRDRTSQDGSITNQGHRNVVWFDHGSSPSNAGTNMLCCQIMIMMK